jgi:exopolyphosphatase/guanosine-5'-triphosphate,3'-diphosphate pyrophosphatase
MLDRGEAVAKKETATTMLAEGLNVNGTLSDAAMERTLSAVAGFFKEAAVAGAAKTYVFATEAVRSAANGAAFRARLEAAIGTRVAVLSAKEEARLGMLGVLGAPDKTGAVLDIGGASVELITGSPDKPDYSKSLPLGAVRVLDSAGTAYKGVARYVAREVKRFGRVSAKALTAIGGTATALASMALGQGTYEPAAVHGYLLEQDVLSALLKDIFSGGDLIARYPTLPVQRARVIGQGAVVLHCVMRHLGLKAVTVSEHDNMEGFLLALPL